LRLRVHLLCRPGSICFMPALSRDALSPPTYHAKRPVT
jgi:hypothetical protein